MLAAWGWRGPRPDGVAGEVARVAGAWGDYYRVVCDRGEGLARGKASVFRRLEPEALPVAGDYVDLEWNPDGESRILAVLPRTSVLRRSAPEDSRRRVQTLAANFDTVFFLTSANGNFSIPRYRRFLELAAESGCRERVVALLTKADLAPELAPEMTAALKAAAPEVPALAISVRQDPPGIGGLEPWAQAGRTLAFVGSSGVGKSSLVNRLAGETVADTCEIQEWSGKGRHTTTSRELLRLASGVLAIDTPGLREFGRAEGDAPRWSAGRKHERRTSTHRWRNGEE